MPDLPEEDVNTLQSQSPGQLAPDEGPMDQVSIQPGSAATPAYSSLPGPDSQNLSPKLPLEGLSSGGISAFRQVPMLP